MIRTFVTIGVVVIICCGALHARGDSFGNAQLPPELEAAIDLFYEAIETGDTEARISLLADNVVIMPNHWNIIEGKASVADVFRGAEGAVFRIRDRKRVHSSWMGDLAYTANSYEYTYHSAEDEPQWHKTKNVHIWRSGETGDWRLELDIWNSDVPVDDFTKENKNPQPDEALIRQAVESLYIKGLQVRDFDLIRKICVPEAVLMSSRSDVQLNVTTLDKWATRFDPDNPPFQSLDCTIASIDVAGTAAQVKILFIVDGERRVTDYLNMLKLDGKWRIVNIIDY